MLPVKSIMLKISSVLSGTKTYLRLHSCCLQQKLTRYLSHDVCYRNLLETSLMLSVTETYLKTSTKPSISDSPATPPASSGSPTFLFGLAQIFRYSTYVPSFRWLSYIPIWFGSDIQVQYLRTVLQMALLHSYLVWLRYSGTVLTYHPSDGSPPFLFGLAQIFRYSTCVPSFRWLSYIPIWFGSDIQVQNLVPFFRLFSYIPFWFGSDIQVQYLRAVLQMAFLHSYLVWLRCIGTVRTYRPSDGSPTLFDLAQIFRSVLTYRPSDGSPALLIGLATIFRYAIFSSRR
jgi:hypothetical protein